MKDDIYLSDERYLAALKRIRRQIAGGLGIEAEDSTTPGDKYTTCTWGLCSKMPQQWPDEEDWLLDKPIRGMISAKYQREGQLCPMDRNLEPEARSEFDGDYPSGCFYRCRIFKRKRGQRLPTRAEALKLYDRAIDLYKDLIDDGVDPELEDMKKLRGLLHNVWEKLKPKLEERVDSGLS